MMAQINERLARARERIQHKRKLEAMYKEAQRQLEEARAQRAAHKQRLDREKADVEGLEGYTLTALFYTILGTKEQSLEKERQEYLAARLKHEAAVEAVKTMRGELERIEQERKEYAQAEAEYEQILREKEQLLIESGDARASKVLDYTERIAELHAEKKELQEAIQAGREAEAALKRVSTELSSAENWGTWDMLGGGMLVTMAKHSHIDTAKRYVEEAQHLLRRFQEELADAGQRLHVALDIGSFTTFADYFFDGLIMDWAVQSKIWNASSACSNALTQVQDALAKCQSQLREVEQTTAAMQEQHRAFLEQD